MSGDRPRDKYDRILWRDDEIPEVDAGFGIWRGGVACLPRGLSPL